MVFKPKTAFLSQNSQQMKVLGCLEPVVLAIFTLRRNKQVNSEIKPKLRYLIND
jgi:hypothetical protein